ncbi:MAG: biotin/lipoyl-binding carrier protein [Pseudomonadota bacterium]|nr:biotin/lipoyl-binding carrier protein [Pseudomonadota bacterium]MEE3100612.1 biotin/lipoyl-binding carrier protein [Pseudomonadota bacterium]
MTTRIEVLSEVAGTVWTVAVAPGATVAEGDEILVLESMKMEIPVPAPAAGAVAEILVAPGQAVEEGQVLARIDR